MEEDSEQVKADVLMKLRKGCRKWPLREVWKTQSQNFQQLWRLKELIEEPKALRDWNSKCKNKLSTDASEEAVSVPFLYQCGQSWKPVACMSHTPTETERQHVQIEKAALAPVHKCKISLLYLWEASVSWTDHKTFLTLPRGTW